jgi:hypothetical protein
MGNQGAARSEWTAGLAALPNGSTDRPPDMAERAALMQRLNMTTEVRPLADRLKRMGYRKVPWQRTGGE